MNLYNRAQVTVDAVEPAGVPRQLFRAVADQRRNFGDGGLPDPAALVTGEEAAGVLGGLVRGNPIGSQAGRTMIWQPTGAAVPILRVEVHEETHSPGGRAIPPHARAAPGVADGYLVDSSAVLHAHPLTVVISVHGTVPAGSEASLISLLPRIEERLRAGVVRSS